MRKTGVIVGSTGADFCEMFGQPNLVYFFGLWCADGYHRTSSIGLSNTNLSLITAFGDFLRKFFPESRLRLRIYIPVRNQNYDYSHIRQKCGISNVTICSIKKAVLPTVHIYVNSRSLLRFFQESRKNVLEKITTDNVWPYFAGRFDGDGSIAKDSRSDCRIVYSHKDEAEKDKTLLQLADIKNSKVYYYKQARTYCLYIYRKDANKFIENIREYSRTQKSAPVTL